MAESKRSSTSVCVCTFRRPTLLLALLDALVAQQGAGSFEVVVVDNDRAGSAAPALAEARRRHPRLRLRDFVEPEQNIALARNRVVHEARGSWLAFIDDDEQPGPRWLATLRAAQKRHRADAVLGPVVPRLPDDAPAWLARGRFHERPRHPTGTAVPTDELRTGNLLIRRALLGPTPTKPAAHGSIEGPFDRRYGLTGGEDTEALSRLLASGARFVWCDEAEVSEAVPRERATLRYLARRSFAGGHGHARWMLRRLGSRAVPRLVVRGAGALGLAALALGWPPGWRQGWLWLARWTRIGAGGLGKLAGLSRVDFQSYRAS